jgi:hypothetical protein
MPSGLFLILSCGYDLYLSAKLVLFLHTAKPLVIFFCSSGIWSDTVSGGACGSVTPNAGRTLFIMRGHESFSGHNGWPVYVAGVLFHIFLLYNLKI